MESKVNNKKHTTFCRICEAYCGLEVTVAPDNKIINIKPDKSHPVSRGYACIKGVSFDHVHDDPDRVNYPLKRVDGQLQRISWNQAIQEIGDKIKALREKHGDRSVGMYQGNPTFFNYSGILMSDSFLDSAHLTCLVHIRSTVTTSLKFQLIFTDYQQPTLLSTLKTPAF